MKLEYLAEGSPDCPLIRLYEFDPVEATRLREAFRCLADGSRKDIPLHEEWWVKSVAGCHLDLRLGAKDLGIVERLPSKFECVLTAEVWLEMVRLTETFCAPSDDPSRDAFQWLNEDGEVSLLLSPSGRW
jgi:hypothetical protein